jgi:starch phosphorylase
MSESPRIVRSVGQGMVHAFAPRPLPDILNVLGDLALDLRWTWSHASDRVWETVDRETWEFTANPWLILQTVSQRRLEELAQDSRFVRELQAAVAERNHYLGSPGWFGGAYPERPLRTVAFFSMEFGLGEALPLYAGGLGILAGDFLKASSDLAVPVVGVGLLYQEGYFRQVIDRDGSQLEAYPYNDPVTMPVFPVRDSQGGWLSVPVELPGRTALLRVWRAHVGRTDLYLLDSNHPLNSPADRGIASKLYDAERDRRLLQEIALGIGGWRLLEMLGIEPEVLHMNEGHPAFAALERAASFAKKNGLAFEEARFATRAGNVFTTHTPVAAGFDTFPPALIVKYFRDYADTLGITMDELLALGKPVADPAEPFNMAFLAGRMSGTINGVSAVHGRVSRRLAQVGFPRFPEHEIPIGHVTNGVHTPSWDSEESDRLWTNTCGKARWMGALENLCEMLARAGDEELWAMRAHGRRMLVEYVRQRLVRDLGQRGEEPEAIEHGRYVLDPNALTLGFARRFTSYKRPTLLLKDAERLRRILRDPVRRVQLVVAGKAHPADSEGKEFVREFAQFVRDPEVRDRAVFLEDYDILIAQHLVQGVDVWINTPRRPWEACGTSGMKVLVNGGLNLSSLDGWWAEAYTPEVGWAVGDAKDSDGTEDDADARRLYEILENQVIPEFYDRDAAGFPRKWLARVRASMSTLTPRFSANRMIREYVERAYLPAASAFRDRAADGGALARQLNAWQNEIRRCWPRIHFGALRLSQSAGRHHFSVELYLAELNPDFVRVELYAEPVDGGAPVRVAMERKDAIPGSINGHFYEADVSAERPPTDYTPRVLPYHRAARLPLEDPHILWQR